MATTRTRKSTPTTADMPARAVGLGVTVAVADGVCTITFPVDGDHGPTASGKSVTVAKAGYGDSPVTLPDGTRVQVMAYRTLPKG